MKIWERFFKGMCMIQNVKHLTEVGRTSYLLLEIDSSKEERQGSVIALHWTLSML